MDAWERAGYKLVNGELVRIKDYEHSATDIRPSGKKRGHSALENNGSGQVTVMERHTVDGGVGALQLQAKTGRPLLIHVTSHRKCLIDDDNLCEKYHIDLLRHAGIIPEDSPRAATITVTQKKTGPKEPERTDIEIYEV